MLWIALFASVLIYAALGVYGPLKREPGDPELLRTMTQVIGVIALANVGAVFGLRGVLAKTLPYQAYCLVRWALCESVAVFGLVLFFMGATIEVLGAFCAVAMFAMVLARPSAGDKEAYDEEKKSA